jgi:hypothetical protein
VTPVISGFSGTVSVRLEYMYRLPVQPPIARSLYAKRLECGVQRRFRSPAAQQEGFFRTMQAIIAFES